MRHVRAIGPFRWILLLWICLLYIWGLKLGSVVREQVRTDYLPLFTLLMLCHAALYGLLSMFPSRSWPRVIYYVLQAVVVLWISSVAFSLSVAIGLYLALVGDAAEYLQKFSSILVMVIGSLIVFSLDIVLVHGRIFLLGTVLFLIPLLLIVMGYVLLFIRQARAREHALALLQELEEAHKQLAEYALRIEGLTLATERRRVARELHDTLAQGLAGLILQLEAMKSHLVNQNNQRALEIVEHALVRARSSLADARSAIDNLRAETLMPINVQQAVQEEVEHFMVATGIACHLQLMVFSALSSVLCEQILRTITEGLTNIARHAQAHTVWVETSEHNEVVEIVVRDDGIGFDPGVMHGQTGHYGLLGLRERARLAGGEFTVRSIPGAGTTLRLRLPASSEGNIS